MKHSNIFLFGIIVALLTIGYPSFILPDAHAAASGFESATTTSTTTIAYKFDQPVHVSVVGIDGAGWETLGNGFKLNGGAAGAGITSAIIKNYSDANCGGAGTTTVVITLDSAIDANSVTTIQFTNGAVPVVKSCDGAAGVDATADGAAITVVNNLPADEETDGSTGSDCYDCIPPKLQQAQIQISSNEKIITTDDDDVLHITANIGDKVTVILNVTDNKPVDTFRFAGLYTNYQDKPGDMNTFYANNYDNLKQVSTSFYEWKIRADDVPYDYDGTVSWTTSVPEIITEPVNDTNFKFKNDQDNTVKYFMIPFTFTINQHMDSTSIVTKVYDGAYNRLHVTLPVILDVAGNDPLNFENQEKQKMLGFYDDEFLTQTLSDWNQLEPNMEQLSEILGIPDESLPAWSANLATWVAEDKIDSANLIVAVEYLINQ